MGTIQEPRGRGTPAIGGLHEAMTSEDMGVDTSVTCVITKYKLQSCAVSKIPINPITNSNPI
jgi:hypothetical protein